MAPLTCFCCICRGRMDWEKRYGRDGVCCDKDCYQEFDWRRTLAILGKAYYPDPKATQPVPTPDN